MSLTVGRIEFGPSLAREITKMVDTLAARLSLMLPWAPSVNHYWRMGKGHMHISAAGEQYRRDVCLLVKQAGQGKKYAGRLRVHVVAHPPDNRKRDLDNVLKALLDSLKYAEVYKDDCQIDDLRIVRGERARVGFVTVEVEEMEGGQ